MRGTSAIGGGVACANGLFLTSRGTRLAKLRHAHLPEQVSPMQDMSKGSVRKKTGPWTGPETRLADPLLCRFRHWTFEWPTEAWGTADFQDKPFNIYDVRTGKTKKKEKQKACMMARWQKHTAHIVLQNQELAAASLFAAARKPGLRAMGQIVDLCGTGPQALRITRASQRENIPKEGVPMSEGHEHRCPFWKIDGLVD